MYMYMYMSVCMRVCMHVCVYVAIWSKCFLPKKAESRIHMGARYKFLTFGAHTQLVNEGSVDQTSIGTKV